MRNQRDNGIYIKHMLDAIEKISSYVLDHTFDTFIENEWDQDATVRNLEIIGEAANNIDSSVRSMYPEIPWRAIIDFRNVAAHDYADVDVDIVWSIITLDLPKLQQQLKSLLE